jgi:hypothetical protein
MDMSKIKGALGKLTFLRNYSAYILPIVLATIAVCLIVVSGFVSRGQRSKIEKDSVKLGKSVKTYISQEISARQWQVEKGYQDALEADANGIAKLVRQTTQRELLSYKLFPEPKDTSVLIFEQFGQSYRQGIEGLIANYGARDCPTTAEIEKAVQRTRGGSQPMAGYGGDEGWRSYSFRSTDKVEGMIIDELCREAAKKASFYADPFDIAGYEYWGKAPSGEGMSSTEVYTYQSIRQSVQACWYWQLGYWIIEDVFKTIGAMNSQCDNVMDCPVKRLMQISFISDTAGAGVHAGGMSLPPSYVRADDGIELGYTGRVSNDQWDIVHFKVTVLIDPRAVLSFMDELYRAKEHTFRGFSGNQAPQKFEHNQITVLETSIKTVDVDADKVSGGGHQLYRYGDDAVVEMELICEYIFERAGYDEIKPQFIKNQPAEAEENY